MSHGRSSSGRTPNRAATARYLHVAKEVGDGQSAMTFSIVAYDGASRMFGAAASSCTPAVGALCLRVRAHVGAVATQAWTNPLHAVDGLELLERHDAQPVVRELLRTDPEPQLRQLAMVDRNGSCAAHTGSDTSPWRGHVVGEGFAVAGNMLVDETTVDAMAGAFEQAAGRSLADRLLGALEAGDAAGGDRRGRQSAALCVVRDQPYPWLDLRVDEHRDPVSELRRVYQRAVSDLLPFVEALPTRDNPRGGFTPALRRAVSTGKSGRSTR